MSEIGYDATIRLLESRRVPHEKAVARARELYPEEAARRDAEIQRNARILETREQLRIKQMWMVVKGDVYALSQARASKQTPGLADLFLTRDALGDVPALAFWWETKRQVGGERSDAQLEFAQRNLAAGVGYGFGDRYHFAEYLRARGIEPPAIPVD